LRSQIAELCNPQITPLVTLDQSHIWIAETVLGEVVDCNRYLFTGWLPILELVGFFVPQHQQSLTATHCRTVSSRGNMSLDLNDVLPLFMGNSLGHFVQIRVVLLLGLHGHFAQTIYNHLVGEDISAFDLLSH
jgi:hypothetical protein